MNTFPVTAGIFSPFSYGKGWTDAIKVTSPAVGAGFTYTVDGDGMERIVSVKYVLTTDATAPVRIDFLSILDQDSQSVMQIGFGTAQAASLAATKTWIKGFGAVVGTPAAGLVAMLPDVWLLPGWKVQINSSGLAAGDQYSAIRIMREKIPLGFEGLRVGMMTGDEYREGLGR